VCARSAGDSLEVPRARSRGRRRTGRVALVLLLDAIMLAAGGYLIQRHLTRERPALAAVAPVSQVEVVLPPDEPPPPADPPSRPAPEPRAPEPPLDASTRSAAPVPAVRPPDRPPPAKVVPPPKRPPVAQGPSVPDAGVALPPPEPPPDAPPPTPPPESPVTEPPPPEPVVAAEPETPDAAPPRSNREWVRAMTRGIRAVVEDHRDVIEDCYRRAARSSPRAEPLQGRIDVHLRIIASGDADEVRVVENQTGSEELAACLVTVMLTWKYPAPGEEAMEFVWPFTFQGR
jgi:hypothetical protein